MGKRSSRDGQSDLSRRGFITAGVGTAAAALLARGSKADASPAPVASQYRIHPAIGVARMGNADPDTFFIGPEAPGYGPLGDAPGTTAPPYKVNGLVKPQGARFRIFEYQLIGGQWTPVQEVNLDTPGVANITWKVHLANKKASFYQFYGPHGETEPPLPLRNSSVADRTSLQTDFGERMISGPSATPQVFTHTGNPSETYPRKPDGSPVIDYLGQLRTDDAGRLIVLGGMGKADYNTATRPPLPTYANNDNWFDDASDGPVSATITVNGVTVDVLGSWVLCAPPDFAPRVRNAVTMYDLLYDMGVRFLSLPSDSAFASGGALARMAQLKADFQPNALVEFPNTVPDFAGEIQPILVAAYDYYFVTDLVTHKHFSLIDPNLGNPDPQYDNARASVFSYLRPPVGATSQSGPQTMPRLLGDDPYLGQEPENVRRLCLTRTQFGLMRNWGSGVFVPPAAVPPPPPDITPWGLDRAALENCVGGAFFPGIEASWQIRNPNLYLAPFRIDHNATSQYLGPNGIPEGTPIGAGHFSRQMAVPWHADFNDCRHEGDFGWWPGQRPDSVYVAASDTRIDWARGDGKFASGSYKSTHDDMQQVWYKFGFVIQQGDVFVETERDSPIP